MCDSRELFFEDNDISFLGPFNAVWESHCFSEFGIELIDAIYEAKENGMLTVNKFWAFEAYNYLIFAERLVTQDERDRGRQVYREILTAYRMRLRKRFMVAQIVC